MTVGGELGPWSAGVLAMCSDAGRVEITGFGPKVDDMQSLALFRLGEQRLIEIILEDAEG